MVRVMVRVKVNVRIMVVMATLLTKFSVRHHARGLVFGLKRFCNISFKILEVAFTCAHIEHIGDKRGEALTCRFESKYPPFSFTTNGCHCICL